MGKMTNQHARALAKLGASKGGKARAAALTSEERREIARKAVRTRWAKEKGTDVAQMVEAAAITDEAEHEKAKDLERHVSAFQGVLRLDRASFPCHVLNSLKRVVEKEAVDAALSAGRVGDVMGYLRIIDLDRFIDAERVEAGSIMFDTPDGRSGVAGHDCSVLVDICNAYLTARERGVLMKQLARIVHLAETIVRACAPVGITALVDEATGFKQVMEEQELNLRLQGLVAMDLQDWVRVFPEEFWTELARLEDVRISARNRPLRWARYVTAFACDAIKEDIRGKLREAPPGSLPDTGYLRRLRQGTEGNARERLSQTVAEMSKCQGMDDFRRHFAHLIGRPDVDPGK